MTDWGATLVYHVKAPLLNVVGKSLHLMALLVDVVDMVVGVGPPIV
jgi:hypothetical protein